MANMWPVHQTSKFGEVWWSKSSAGICACIGIRYTHVDTSFTSSKVASIEFKYSVAVSKSVAWNLVIILTEWDDAQQILHDFHLTHWCTGTPLRFHGAADLLNLLSEAMERNWSATRIPRWAHRFWQFLVHSAGCMACRLLGLLSKWFC